MIDLIDRLSGPIKRPTQQLEMLERQAQRTDTAMDRLATGGGFVAAGAAIAAPLIYAYTVASDLNEALNKNAVVFGRHAREVQRWGNLSSRALGMARVEAIGTAGTFGNLFTSMGINQGKAAGLSMDIVTLGSDLASFNNTRPTDALEALRSGLTGEIEPLRRYGINLTAANVAQKAFAMGLTPKVMEGADLSPSIKALATYQVILDQSKNAQGDFARTANGSANALRSIRGGVSDLAGTIGGQLEPVFSPLIVGFRDLLFRANRFAEANPFLSRVLALTTLGVAALLVVIGTGIITLATFTLATAQARLGLFRLGLWTRNVTAAMRLYVTGGVATAAQTRMLSGRFATLNLTLAYTRARFAAATTAARAFRVSILASVQLRIAALRALGLSGALQIVRAGLVNATRAAWAFTASLLTNPVFLLIAAITLLGGSFIYAWRKSEDFRAGVMRGLSPITRAWAGLKEDVASLGRAFGPLGATFQRVMQRMGIDLSLVQRPLDALAYGFGYFIGFVGTATAIVFGRVITTLTTGLGGVVQIVDGLVTAAHGLVTLDFGKMMEGLDKASGGLQQLVLSPLELAGIDSKQFRDDLNSASGKARAWQRQVGTWLGVPASVPAPDTQQFAFGLNTAMWVASGWGLATRAWVGQKFQTAKANTTNLLDSLTGASNEGKPAWQSLLDKVTAPFDLPRVNRKTFTVSLENAATAGSSLWTTAKEQFPAFALPALNWAKNFVSSLTSAETAGTNRWADIKKAFPAFSLPWIKHANLKSSLAKADEVGGDAWDAIKKLFPTFNLPWIKHAPFKGSLNKADEVGGDAWDAIKKLFPTFNLPWIKHAPFKGSLNKADSEGAPIWQGVVDFLKTKITLPGLDITAIGSSLQDVLDTITAFGPQMLTAGQDLIGNLIAGFNERIGELTAFLDGLKFPWQKEKGSGGGGRNAPGAGPNLPIPAVSATYAPPIANRVNTPDAMRPMVGRGVSPNVTFTPEQLVKFSGVNPGSEYGKLLVEGLAQGVMTNTQVANFAVNRMAADVEATFRQRLDMHSPSRLFRGLGGFIPQSLGQGIVGQRGLVTGAMRTLAAAALAVPITAQLGVPALGDEPMIPAPPAIGRAASEPSPGERARAEVRAASAQSTHKTISFAGANFNLDMSQINSREDFVGKLESLFEWFGNDE